MKVAVLFLLLALIVTVYSAPTTTNDINDDLSPFNEVPGIDDDEDDGKSSRGKRKVGIVGLGITNGLLNFVFGKLDAFLDAKTRALEVLDDGNKAKNEAFEIDASKSATGEFINKYIAQSIKATSGGIGPLVNAGSTFLSTAKQGIVGAIASKFAPLSSLSGGLSGGLSGSSGSDANGEGGTKNGGGSDSGTFISGIVGSLSAGQGGNGGGGLAGLSSLSGSLSGNGQTDNEPEDVDFPNIPTEDPIGDVAYTNVAGAGKIQKSGKVQKASSKPTRARATTTTEKIPEFNREKVALDVPPELIGNGYSLLTKIGTVVGSLVMNSAKRTETILEVFKPLFRGVFSIKGLPSDKPK